MSNNALTIRNHDKGKGKGKGRGKGKGKGRGRDNFRNPNRHRPPQPRTSETRDEGKGKGRNQKGKSTSANRTYGDRQPKDPCSYCGGDNHSARTCYKRQNDEKNEKSPTTHKQANLNLQIEETALMFQSVLSVYASGTEPHPDTTRWGESTTVNDTTNSDHEEEDSDSGEDYEEYKEDPFYHEETHESTKETDSTINKEERTGNEQEDITLDAEEGARSNPEQDANQSSSVEPTWGTWRRETPKEIENNWEVWAETNIDKEKTTQVYRHGRCHLCDKPVSSTNMDERTVLICWECKRTIIENEGQENKDDFGDKGQRR